MGSTVRALPCGLYRLGSLAWDLSPGTSRLGPLAWDLSPGISRLGAIVGALSSARYRRRAIVGALSSAHYRRRAIVGALSSGLALARSALPCPAFNVAECAVGLALAAPLDAAMQSGAEIVASTGTGNTGAIVPRETIAVARVTHLAPRKPPTLLRSLGRRPKPGCETCRLHYCPQCRASWISCNELRPMPGTRRTRSKSTRGHQVASSLRRTRSPRASDAVKPGDSMPNRLISPDN